MKKTVMLKNPFQLPNQRVLKIIPLWLLALLFSASTAIAQNIVVKGRILKQDGQPVPRASVLIKGTTKEQPAMTMVIFKYQPHLIRHW